MKSLPIATIAFFVLCASAYGRDPGEKAVRMIERPGRTFLSESRGEGCLSLHRSPGASWTVAQASTTWIGWLPGAYDPVSNPHSIGEGGVWDFDDRGTRPCPLEDGFHEYLKNGAYAQGWTSEDVLAQRGLYWHAEDFADPAFACQGNTALSGSYSAWCGAVKSSSSVCFYDAPGYGHRWSQWLCKKFENPTGLAYTYKSDTEAGYDYSYVVIDREFPDSCGWLGPLADSLRCYTGVAGPGTESFDLTNLPGADPDFCESGTYTTPDYSTHTAKICFVVISDNGWDDEDGEYTTCDGAFTVDDIVVSTLSGSDTTTFEDGTLEGWTRCGGFSPGDFVAVRDRNSVTNNDPCGFDGCSMAGCVLTYYNPDIAGQYGTGGHYPGLMHKRAWSPTIDLSAYPPRGYAIKITRYADLPMVNWIFARFYMRYVQDPGCPTGTWSPPVTDGYIYYYSQPGCWDEYWIYQLVPADAESVQIGYSVWNGCMAWEVPCTTGNDSPALDNVRLGIWELSAPSAVMRAVDNYTDAFPEDDSLGGNPSSATALIDIATNMSQEGYFLRLGDTAHVQLGDPDAVVEFCFRVVPGPGTDTGDMWFAKYGEEGISACDTTDVHCTRMDTCFTAGNGIAGSPYEFQKTVEGSYATMIHEKDPLYVAEGEEILPDSLFTPGSKIFYAIRTSYEPGTGPYNWTPSRADPSGADLSSWYEVEVLPDQCKDPLACLLYVDYYNRAGSSDPIETALSMLGRSWDRFDLRAESSHQGNGIGNRLLGPGRYRLDRGPIGPSLDHLAQYRVMLISNGRMPQGATFSDGGNDTPDDPTNDITFLDNWLSEGTRRGLWLNGDNIASDFDWAASGPKPGFLHNELAAELVSENYRREVGHPLDESCRLLFSRGGGVTNSYSSLDSLSLGGSGCPQMHEYDVLAERSGGTGRVFAALLYDRTDETHPPGLYASIDHAFKAPNAPYDTVRTKIDGFSMLNLRMNHPECSGTDNIMIALWMRDVLGGTEHYGYFYDADLGVQYCPPTGPETIGVPGPPGRRYFNALFQNYPNPFRVGRGTTIRYVAAKKGPAQIRVFDAAGRLVTVLEQEARPGVNVMCWDGTDDRGRPVASGVYFYQISMGGFAAHKKMLVLR